MRCDSDQLPCQVSFSLLIAPRTMAHQPTKAQKQAGNTDWIYRRIPLKTACTTDYRLCRNVFRYRSFVLFLTAFCFVFCFFSRVLSPTLQAPACSTQCNFGFPGSRASFCFAHKLAGQVNVNHRICQVFHTRCSYGLHVVGTWEAEPGWVHPWALVVPGQEGCVYVDETSKSMPLCP